MILDVCSDCSKYEAILPGITDAIADVLAHKDREPGNYPYRDGYYMIQKGNTRAYEGPLETHKKYIDIQIVLGGRERIRWANRKIMKQTTEYNPDIDMIFYDCDSADLIVREGMFYVLDLNDGHRVCCNLEGNPEYFKAIVKIPVREE